MLFCCCCCLEFHGTGDCLVKERKLLETKIKREGAMVTALGVEVYA